MEVKPTNCDELIPLNALADSAAMASVVRVDKAEEDSPGDCLEVRTAKSAVLNSDPCRLNAFSSTLI